MSERQNPLQRALFRVLYNHRRHSAGLREAKDAAATATAAPTLVAATQEDLDAGAACRFCFEGGPKRLVAPCSCRGSQKWIHESCLVRWQRVAGTTSTPNRNTVCNVCNTRFALEPPPPPKMPGAKAGMLLVSNRSLGGSFERSVILLCEVNELGAHGVIVNRRVDPGGSEATRGAAQWTLTTALDELPLAEVAEAGRAEAAPTRPSASALGATLSTTRASPATRRAERLAAAPAGGVAVDWRRGGPVCGGRLGVVNYTVLHTLGAQARVLPSSHPPLAPSTPLTLPSPCSTSASPTHPWPLLHPGGRLLLGNRRARNDARYGSRYGAHRLRGARGGA